MRLLPLLLALCLCLTGCIQYDVGIHYRDQTHGEIVQRIALGGQLPTTPGSTVRAWLSSLERQAKALGGSVRRPSQEELLVTIPFFNGKDLSSKFNQLFHPDEAERDRLAQSGVPDLPPIDARLALQESNLLLVQRDRLTYDLDLRSLAVLTADGSPLIGPGSLLTLDFALETPWGARSLNSTPAPVQTANRLLWQLQPGTQNHLEAVFWLPSPLGIGTLAIAALVLLGIGLKRWIGPTHPNS